MDWITDKNSWILFLKKYRYAMLALAMGILLLWIPDTESTKGDSIQPASEEKSQCDLEESLSGILSMIDGVGDAEVLLTQSRGELILYQTDDDVSSGERTENQRSDTVLINGEGRLETGLIKQINPPEYQGAIIVCQGADDPNVRLCVVEAVMRVTGLTSDKITVLKMK